MMFTNLNANRFLRLSIAIIILGALFKIMHWPYGWVAIAIGAFGIGVNYCIIFVRKKPKSLLDYTQLFLLLSFFVHYTLRVFHLSYAYIFTTITQLFLVLFIILYLKDTLFTDRKIEVNHDESSKKNKSKTIIYLLYGIAITSILIGSLFKILHWGFGFINGTSLFIFGIILIVILLLLGDSYSKAK